ncbi:protein phosphatase 2C 77-like isoform X2 [Mercurialis annua]|uniref:protein phosphatase 2C 77-like isoform X2 n=1 Tax=Mercurialis annua TaxID=3986 RepID=UPI00215F44E2|nr:protein phosphatase 2C 77-like isoform X2 [Mercurialis annua]
MEELSPAIAVPFNLDKVSVICNKSPVTAHREINCGLKRTADMANLKSNPVRKINPTYDSVTCRFEGCSGDSSLPGVDQVSSRGTLDGQCGDDPLVENLCSQSVGVDCNSTCRGEFPGLDSNSSRDPLDVERSDGNFGSIIDRDDTVSVSAAAHSDGRNGYCCDPTLCDLPLEEKVYELENVPIWGSTSICGRRPEMEDAFAGVPNHLQVPAQMLMDDHGLSDLKKKAGCFSAHFFGVYDGHGGSQVANYCSKRIHVALAEELEFAKANISDGCINDNWQEKWEKVFSNCFVKVDEETAGSSNDSEAIAPETVGSTAVVAVVCPTHIIVANCGDSRAVLCRGKTAMPMSVDHKPDREDECARIEAAGGKIIQWNGARVLGVLAMSRSIVYFWKHRKDQLARFFKRCIRRGPLELVDDKYFSEHEVIFSNSVTDT